MKTLLLLIIAYLILAPVTLWADPAITGPISAKVIKVYDGDTFTVEKVEAGSIEVLIQPHIALF